MTPLTSYDITILVNNYSTVKRWMKPYQCCNMMMYIYTSNISRYSSLYLSSVAFSSVSKQGPIWILLYSYQFVKFTSFFFFRKNVKTLANRITGKQREHQKNIWITCTWGANFITLFYSVPTPWWLDYATAIIKITCVCVCVRVTLIICEGICVLYASVCSFLVRI